MYICIYKHISIYLYLYIYIYNHLYNIYIYICKLKPNFVFRDQVISSSSKRILDCVVPNRITYIDHNSPNVIYLITCCRCFLQYNRESVQKFNKRFNWYRTGFNQPGKYCFCHILSDHFHKSVSCNTSYSVQLLKVGEKW